MYSRPLDALNALNVYFKICKLALINHKRFIMGFPKRFVFSQDSFYLIL